MEEKSDDVPLPKPPLKVGIIYNLKKGTSAGPADAEAEYDSIDTVRAIGAALEKGGELPVLLEADETLPQRLLADRPDIVFNIAEGFRGRGREAQIPALLNMLDIPFTGSDETTLCVCLDKALTKRLLATYGVRTPGYTVIPETGRFSARGLRYPVIVKPVAEGSSKGVTEMCTASTREELAALAGKLTRLYGESMLAEEYVAGREFTVGLLGNGENVRVFSPMEILFRDHSDPRHEIYSYHVKQHYKDYVEYRCPAELDPAAEAAMTAEARKIFLALGCRDFARVDFRLDAAGVPWFIEINPLPGMAPGYSDYPMLAEFCGVPYDELVLSVFRAAAQRCGLRV